jgi:hypothetical protein
MPGRRYIRLRESQLKQVLARGARVRHDVVKDGLPEDARLVNVRFNLWDQPEPMAELLFESSEWPETPVAEQLQVRLTDRRATTVDLDAELGRPNAVVAPTAPRLMLVFRSPIPDDRKAEIRRVVAEALASGKALVVEGAEVYQLVDGRWRKPD